MTKPTDPRVDLHGETLADVAGRLEEELRRAHRARQRRLVIVHGLGNHSESGRSPLARAVRERLKALEAAPGSAIVRLEFGEESDELERNAGCVRVTLALDAPADRLRFAPTHDVRSASSRRREARRAPLPDSRAAEESLRRAEEELRRRYGKP